jgi:ferredoxin
MAHHTLKTSYSDLVERLNRFPQGAPPSELLNKILQVLFSEKEAQLVSLLPIKPFTAEKAMLNEDRCLGCGVCVRNCTYKSILLKSRAKRVLTPLNGVHKAVVMAVERGNLQHLIFDNRVLFSHRALAAVLGVLLKLPPLKQAMARQQIKSRYFEKLVRRIPI